MTEAAANREDDVERAMARTMRETTGAGTRDVVGPEHRPAGHHLPGRPADASATSSSTSMERPSPGPPATPNIPQPGPDWPRVHVYVPIRQRVNVKNAGRSSGWRRSGPSGYSRTTSHAAARSWS